MSTSSRGGGTENGDHDVKVYRIVFCCEGCSNVLFTSTVWGAAKPIRMEFEPLDADGAMRARTEVLDFSVALHARGVGLKNPEVCRREARNMAELSWKDATSGKTWICVQCDAIIPFPTSSLGRKRKCEHGHPLEPVTGRESFTSGVLGGLAFVLLAGGAFVTLIKALMAWYWGPNIEVASVFVGVCIVAAPIIMAFLGLRALTKTGPARRLAPRFLAGSLGGVLGVAVFLVAAKSLSQLFR